MAIIILPPGSTENDLQIAINGADSGDIIEISSNIMFTGSVVIPTDRSLTIQSNTVNNWVLTQTSPNVRHFIVDGSLTLENITLNGGNIGGGIQVNIDANVTINTGTIIQNCSSVADGGGINNNGTLIMNDGLIFENDAFTGGGVHVDGGEFIMTGGAISNNEATTPANSGQGFGGGGVRLTNNATFNMSGNALISGNRVPAVGISGGGVTVTGGAEFIMTGGIIEYNWAYQDGSGVEINGFDSIFRMTGGEIRYNGMAAPNAVYTLSGGAVHIRSGGEFVMGSLFGGSQVPILHNNIVLNNGGGVGINTGTFIMNGGIIEYNVADSVLPGRGNGGGVRLNTALNIGIVGTFHMHGGEIRNNVSTTPSGGGGGVSVDSVLATSDLLSNLMISGGIIRDNIAHNNGGGVHILRSELSMNSGIISGNTARNGGGIYSSDSIVVISGNSEITNNAATYNGNGQGGGIYTDNFYNLTILGPFVRFANNRADFATAREPINDAVYMTHVLNMENNWTVPFLQGYNNFDINQNGPRVEVPNLEVLKSADTSEVSVGETLTYTIRVNNLGETQVNGVSVSDDLNLTLMGLVSGSVLVNGAPATYSFIGGRLTINIGTLAVGESVTITFQVEILAAAVGQEISNVTILHIPGLRDVYSNEVLIEVFDEENGCNDLVKIILLFLLIICRPKKKCCC